MCFGSKLKGDDPSSRLNNDYNDHLNSRPVESKPSKTSHAMPQDSSYQPPAGPPPSHQYQSPEIYGAPAGPPPNRNNEYSAPSGPPPNRSNEYSAPSGPPPNRTADYSAPDGPPPSHSYDAPPQEPYHDWQTAVPDTSLLPPPPSMGNQRSATNNATEQQAELGEIWCSQNPMTGPVTFPEAALEAIDKGEIGVIRPRDYQGNLERPRPGVWAGKTKASTPDNCIISTLPLYSVMAHSPLRTARTKSIYYEVRIKQTNRREVSLAMGFGAQPYPTFRLPGWHRGNLAVHGDDGSKYINDRWGGKDFTQPFKAGETLGIGMIFTARNLDAPPSYDSAPAQTMSTNPIDIEVFFTRDGRKESSWNLHEEGDAEEDLPVTGLEGFNDLYAMVGTFENVEFEIVFNQGEWMYHP
ncbi:hypothetical protein ONS95_009151 [Cadophora gregata]|uniref:uncharacterized protein n=1 Tax=Cadophora gregata TaxID=51156 RepID=UPI0026DAD7B2|nr:uncharacterized protein ONS95_009151 [Cadophora gregata]KAK0124169.1 hypothetical protein ONS95_009151 [Cadophora gregata]KAK0130501.1 hypothetical protein ONS96_001018 [Cadophora gregata f. sp. sojae]